MNIGERISLFGILIAAIGILASFFVPEIRQKLGLETSRVRIPADERAESPQAGGGDQSSLIQADEGPGSRTVKSVHRGIVPLPKSGRFQLLKGQGFSFALDSVVPGKSNLSIESGVFGIDFSGYACKHLGPVQIEHIGTVSPPFRIPWLLREFVEPISEVAGTQIWKGAQSFGCLDLTAGNSTALSLSINGPFAVIQVLSIGRDSNRMINQASFKYVFQPDGSTTFRDR